MDFLCSMQDSPNWEDDDTGSVSRGEFQVIKSLLPDNVLLLMATVGDWLDDIYEDERVLVENAVPRRQFEFATGRMLAAEGLRQFNIPAAAIPQGAMKEPIWPHGVMGSISHTTDVCMLAMASSNDYEGLGIDLETRPAEFSELERMILRQDERRHRESGGLDRDDRVRLVFSAKESVYKAIHAHVGRFVDFQEVRIELSRDQDRFTASAPDDPQLDALVGRGAGRFRITENFVFTIWSYN
jgi:4'-phosphopantetheinyl transferase EntD